MSELTGVERVAQFLRRKPMDRVPVFEHINDDPCRAWKQAGHLPPGDVGEHFGFDIREGGGFDMTADLDFQPQVVCEDDERRVVLDGNSATFRRHRVIAGAPEPVCFGVQNRRDWQEKIKPHLMPTDLRRVDRAGYRAARAQARANGEFFTITDYYAFDRIHPVIGYQTLLTGLCDDPGWIREMADTYGDLFIRLAEELIALEGKPDGFCVYEDMGFNHHAFLSPAMYRECFLPAHKRLIDWAHGLGCPVIFHSSGNVEKLLPALVEAGIDCLQTLHVNGGMDLLKLYREYGDRLSFLGGIDARVMATNDRSRIAAELERKLPVVMLGHGYCLHSDFCVPADMDYDAFVYFLDVGRELGKY